MTKELIDDLKRAEAERDAARAEIESRIEDRDYWHGVATKAKDQRDAALAAVERIRQAVSGHPECDRYEEGDVISCGWKSAYASVVAALDGAPEPDNDDPCDAEVYSWDHFRPEQIDSYWIKCTLLGKHDEHEDSHTGLKWGSGLPVEGESKP